MVGLGYMPEVVLQSIFSYLSYDEISHLRIVCRQFDRVCKKLLNKGFVSVERYHSHCLKAVKAQLPRRESERRNHPLSRHCDILTAIETRLSMLSMTFMKYVDFSVCCFIPGKVIDEIFRVLRSIQNTKTPPRAHEILQELRDISSMAMEHFDEKIAPALKQSLASSPQRISIASHGAFSMPGTSLLSGSHTPRYLAQEKLRREFRKIQSTSRHSRASICYLKKEISVFRLQLNRQRHHQTNQMTKIRDQAAKLKDHETQIADLKRHLEEYDQKFADLAAEHSKARSDPASPGQLEPIALCSSGSSTGGLEENSAQVKPASVEAEDLPGRQLKRKAAVDTCLEKRFKPSSDAELGCG